MADQLRFVAGCHVLQGRPIPVGAVLELSLAGGGWLPCRYRWNRDPDSQPVFSIILGGRWERLVLEPAREPPEAVLRVELADAEFRWPPPA
jgi:hypothetical protein